VRAIRKVLPAAVGNEEVVRAGVAKRHLDRWPEVVGEMLAAKSWPDRYTRGTVWVAVQGSAWAQELRLMKPKILERLRDMSGDPEMFTDVRFGVRQLPVAESEPEEPRTPATERDTPLSIREIAERRLAKRRHERGT
jgi:predicted nucleic acid-binding Zn ribbon protein